MSPSVPEAKVPLAINEATDLLKQLSKGLDGQYTREIAELLGQSLTKHSTSVLSGDCRSIHLCDGVEILSEEVIVDLSAIAGVPILASVTCDPEWLYPDDPRLWRHLVRCKTQRAYAVFISRKISIATFPVLKRLSALGIQLHQLFVSDESLTDVQDLSRQLDWLSIGAISKVATHPGLDMIRKTFSGMTRSFALQLAYESIEVGNALGLADDTRGSPGALLDWSRSADVKMPDKWHAVVQEWATWDGRGLLRKPYDPKTSWP